MAEWIKRFEKIKSSSSDNLVSKVLKARGIPEEQHMGFLSPDDSFEYSYELMRNATRASKKIKEHIEKGSHIIGSGDPDADGVVSLAILIQRLMSEVDEANLTYIYPQRNMGHGILGQIKGKESLTDEEKELVRVNKMKVEMADLIIIVDSSSNDIEGLKELRKINPDIEVIILDHHEFDNLEIEKEMDSMALVVNPKHSKDEYPNKHLSGAGVVYKVCQSLDVLNGDEGLSDEFLDLVAIGLVGDMMDVSELENRYLITQGLQNVKNIGLSRILKGAKVNTYRYNAKDIGYSVAPLINASARMGKIELAIEILLVDNDKDAKPLRLKMDKLNKERQKIQKEIVDKYIDNVDTSQKIIIISDDESNKGFNGLVAQNIAQKYQRPCFVVRDHDGMCMGSGRSFGGFNTQNFLSELDWVEATGHDYAHGLNFPSDKLDELKEYIKENMPDELSSEAKIYYDVDVNIEDLWFDFEDIETLNYITGQGFPEVTAKVSDVMVVSRDIIGKTKETVKIATAGDLVLIKFKVDENWHSDIDIFDEVSAIGTPTINVFYNFGTKETTRTPQIIIRDIIKEW